MKIEKALRDQPPHLGVIHGFLRQEGNPFAVLLTKQFAQIGKRPQVGLFFEAQYADVAFA